MILDALVKKFTLTSNDTFDNAIDGLPPMFDISKQIDRRPHLFLDEILGFLRRFALVQ